MCFTSAGRSGPDARWYSPCGSHLAATYRSRLRTCPEDTRLWKARSRGSRDDRLETPDEELLWRAGDGVGGSLRRSRATRSEEHTSELLSPCNLVCRLLLEKKKITTHSLL